jgi:predicted RND superfamily exporter protein
VFGAMGWLRLPVEIGTVMTASVALGIAVDDTIHFLTWYKRGMLENKTKMGAIRFAFEHCAKPMIDATLICGFGVAAFMFSDFMPTVRFSRLLFILLAAALIGDLFLLPAILAGPLGRFFRPRVKSEQSTPVKDSTKSPSTERVVA